jgi:predicted ArsR family transcriptional regulator
MKKNYNKGGLLTLLGENKEEQQLRKEIQLIEKQYQRETRGRPKTNFKEVNNESERGTLAGETRATFIISKDHLTKLKQIAYWNRKQLKQIVAEALQETITKYEKKNGTLKKIPQ